MQEHASDRSTRKKTITEYVTYVTADLDVIGSSY